MTAATESVLAEFKDPDEGLVRNGRYYIIPADGGKAKAYTRATRVAETLEDRTQIEKWQLRTLALGLVARADIHALVASKTPDEKRELGELCQQALDAGKASSGANIGKALHTFTEQVDRGKQVTPPAPYDNDIAAYRAALVEHGIRIVPHLIERVVVHDELKIAGRFDRIVRLADGRHVVADLKTGGFLPWGAIAIQLAIYANANAIYTPANGWRDEMPNDLDPTVGLVIHLPAGTAQCQLYTVDLVAGWEACQIALAARSWRNAKVSAPYLHDTARPAPDGQRAALVARVETIRDRGHLTDLASTWPAGVPPLKSDHAHTAAELEQIAVAVSTIEIEHGYPF